MTLARASSEARRLAPFVKQQGARRFSTDVSSGSLLADGSVELFGNLAVASGITIDGVDISQFYSDVQTYAVTAGSGLSGGGLISSSPALFVNQGFAFNWTAAHTFNSAPTFVNGATANKSMTGTYGLVMGRRDWSADGVGYGGAAIYNDGGTYQALMIVGSDVAGSGVGQGFAYENRVVELYDQLQIGLSIEPLAGYSSGFAGSGYRLDHRKTRANRSFLEVDDLSVRGTLVAYEMEIKRIRTSLGNQLFSSGGGRVESVTGSGPYTITFVDDHGLVVGDQCRAQRMSGIVAGNTLGGGVFQSDISVASVINSRTITATLLAGSAPQFGFDYAQLGHPTNTSRQGSVYMALSDSGAPFLDVRDGVLGVSDWNVLSKTRVRVGRLSGVTDPLFGTLTGYGIYTDRGYFTGGIRATGGRFDGIVDIGVNGEIRQGTGTWGGNWTGTRLWNESGVGRIGGYKNSVLQWASTTDGRFVAGTNKFVVDQEGAYVDISSVSPSSGYTRSNGIGFWHSAIGDVGGMDAYYNATTPETRVLTVGLSTGPYMYFNRGGSSIGSAVIQAGGNYVNVTYLDDVQIGPVLRSPYIQADRALLGELATQVAAEISSGSASGASSDYSPTLSKWNNSDVKNANFILSGPDFQSIGFHDSGNRVDYIVVGGGVIRMGFDGGWGNATTSFQGPARFAGTFAPANLGFDNVMAGVAYSKPTIILENAGYGVIGIDANQYNLRFTNPGVGVRAELDQDGILTLGASGGSGGLKTDPTHPKWRFGSHVTGAAAQTGYINASWNGNPVKILTG